jgi:hypothetical protein
MPRRRFALPLGLAPQPMRHVLKLSGAVFCFSLFNLQGTSCPFSGNRPTFYAGQIALFFNVSGFFRPPGSNLF